MSDMLRITGMVSGMDTDATVKKLIALETKKVDRAKQDKILLEWKRDAYRDITNQLRAFKEEFFDVLKPNKNLRSEASFNAFEANVSNEAVSAKATAGSTKGSIVIKSVDSIATQDTYFSASAVSDGIKSSEAMADIASINDKIAAGKNKISFTLDGVTKRIELSGSYADMDAFKADLQTKLDEQFNGNVITVDITDSKLSFEPNGAGHKLEMSSAYKELLDDLKIENGSANKTNIYSKIKDSLGLEGDINLTINGKSDFGITGDDTLDDIMRKINYSDAGVKISYNEFEDTFKLVSNKTGVANSISMEDPSGLFSKLKLTNHKPPEDAQFTLIGEDGSEITTTRSNNTFNVKGTLITLNKPVSEQTEIKVSPNTEDVKKNIMEFVEKYNEMIKYINDKTVEKKYRDYKPLTSEQKKAMEEDEEKVWTEKAKSGLLRSDRLIEDITNNMRRALYEKVEGTSLTLDQIGISTSDNYKDRGKLIVDEEKLGKALSEKPNEVSKLFNKESEIAYLDRDNDQQRYNENGLANRLYDIINDNIRTVNGKGLLIQKAGNEFGIDTDSDLYKKIEKSDFLISELLEKLNAKENEYYAQFARMETMMSKLESQQASFFQQLGM